MTNLKHTPGRSKTSSLSFPYELRRQVYEEFIPSQEKILVGHRYNRRLGHFHSLEMLSMLLAGRSINEDVTTIFYGVSLQRYFLFRYFLQNDYTSIRDDAGLNALLFHFLLRGILLAPDLDRFGASIPIFGICITI